MNQKPERTARDFVDQQLIAGGWTSENTLGYGNNTGTGVYEYDCQSNESRAHYLVFAERRTSRHIDIKPKDWMDLAIHSNRCPYANYFNPEQIISDHTWQRTPK